VILSMRSVTTFFEFRRPTLPRCRCNKRGLR
jgi:hypothetical protein